MCDHKGAKLQLTPEMLLNDARWDACMLWPELCTPWPVTCACQRLFHSHASACISAVEDSLSSLMPEPPVHCCRACFLAVSLQVFYMQG